MKDVRIAGFDLLLLQSLGYKVASATWMPCFQTYLLVLSRQKTGSVSQHVTAEDFEAAVEFLGYEHTPRLTPADAGQLLRTDDEFQRAQKGLIAQINESGLHLDPEKFQPGQEG